jgi:23S rRNA pseudouridine1911/1915/1917 synthase
MVDSPTRLQARVPEEMAGRRLDQILAELFPGFSRSRLQVWIRQGMVRVDGQHRRTRDRLLGGEAIFLEVGELPLDATERCEPQDIPLDVVFEDESIIVLNKPAGMVVHPAAGNPDGTVQNALLHHAPELAALPRAGLVHRLDKDTTGLMVVARSLKAHKHLVESLQAREMGREYQTVVNGVMTGGGRVDAPIGRHPVDRKRMAVRDGGKPAVTHYRVVERFRAHTHLRVSLETGRTHQIRVHLAHIRHPLVGDPVYGGRQRIPPQAGGELIAVLRGFRRQALHAGRLSLIHPETGEAMEWSCPLPEDMRALLAVLRADRDAVEGVLDDGRDY